MKIIEDKILSVSNEGLIKKLEEEWSALETMYKDWKQKLNSVGNSEKDLEKIVSQAESIFTRPLEIRKKGNFELRQLLSMVWFS